MQWNFINMHSIHEQWNATHTWRCSANILLTRKLFQPKNSILTSNGASNQWSTKFLCYASIFYMQMTLLRLSKCTTFTSNGTLYNSINKFTSSKHFLKHTRESIFTSNGISNLGVLFSVLHKISSTHSNTTSSLNNHIVLTSNGTLHNWRNLMPHSFITPIIPIPIT